MADLMMMVIVRIDGREVVFEHGHWTSDAPHERGAEVLANAARELVEKAP